jgi:hypothetical protein
MTCSGDGQRGGHLNYTVRVCRLLLHRTHSGNGVALAAVPLQRSANNIAVMVSLSSVCVSQARSGRTMPGGTPAIAIRTSLTSFPPTNQPANQPSSPASLTQWCFQRSLGATGAQDRPTDASSPSFCTTQVVWVWTPILERKNVAITTLLGEFPELPSSIGILLGCGHRDCT